MIPDFKLKYLNFIITSLEQSEYILKIKNVFNYSNILKNEIIRIKINTIINII